MGNDDNPPRERLGRFPSALLRYGAAMVGIALATWVRLLLDPIVGEGSPFSVVLLAILLTAWYAGLRPALAATVVGFFLADYFLVPPRGSLVVRDAQHWIELVAYLALGTGIAVLGGRMRAARLAGLQALEQTRRSLADTEGRLSLTLSASGIGSWTRDIAENRITADDRCAALFDLSAGQFPTTLDGLAALVHPDDRERVQEGIAASVERGSEYKMEFRVVRRDGTVRTLAARGKADRGGAGRPRTFSGLCWDVTEHYEEQEQLRLANEKLKESVQELERSKAQTVILSAMNDLLQACSSSKEAYGIIAQYCGHLFPTYAGALYITSASRNLVSSVASWNDPPGSELEFEPHDCWALRRGQPHVTDPGQIDTPCPHLKDVQGGHACLPLTAQGTGIGILYLQRHNDAESPEAFLPPKDRKLAQAIAESVAMSLSNLSLQEALRRQSIRDPLTGLFNRRYLEESVERELYRLARREQSAGFAMLDLDHFKSFNDTFGHEGGDALLRTFGQFLREHLRKEDIACRYGGEEFCILFCELSLEDTVSRAEQIRSGVSRLGVQHGGQNLGAVTVSIGVAAYPTHGSTLSDLIAAADGALYQAKAAGRDRVVAATTSPTSLPAPQSSGR